MHVWVNGRLLTDPQSPAIVVTDHGLTVGDGVFEAVKVVDGRPFALTRHLERLGRSAAALGLPAPDLDAAARSGRRGARPGAAAAGPGPDHLHRRPGAARVGTRRRRADDGRGGGPDGAGAARPRRWSRVPWPRNERGALAGVKSTSYAENVVALAEAAKHGATEAIFANLAGHLCEGTGSNVGYVVGGEVRTPTLASGCLAGRDQGPAARVVRRARGRRADRGARLRRRDLPAVHDARRAGGAPVDDRDLEAPGPVTRELMELWAAREAEDVDP